MVNLKRQKHQNKILILLPTLWTIICCTDPLVERPFPPASSDIDSTTNALSKMDWWKTPVTVCLFIMGYIPLWQENI